MDSICPRCHGSQESTVQVSFECPFANIIWRHLSLPLNISNIPPRSALEWIQLILNPSAHLGLNLQDAHTFTLLFAVTCDRIWWSCNKLVFDSLLLTCLLTLLPILTELSPPILMLGNWSCRPPFPLRNLLLLVGLNSISTLPSPRVPPFPLQFVVTPMGILSQSS